MQIRIPLDLLTRDAGQNKSIDSTRGSLLMKPAGIVALGLVILEFSACLPHALAQDISETLLLEKYTVLNATQMREEQGHLMRDGQFHVILPSTDTYTRDLLDEFLPVSGYVIISEALFTSLSNSGYIPNWVRSDRLYHIGFSDYVIVCVRGHGDPNPPYITSASQLPSATAHLPYTTAFNVDGRTPPHTWSVVLEPLPPGLSLAPGTGILSGTPSQHGTFIFRIAVRDSEGRTVAKDFTMFIACGHTLSPAGTNHSAVSGSGTFAVTTSADCSWSAMANQSWIHTSSSGTGNGTVYYRIDRNYGADFRTGTITVGSEVFTITQGPAGYVWHPVFGWLYDGGGNWYYHNGFDWMWFSNGPWIWSESMQGWIATVTNSPPVWSPQFRWLTPWTNDFYHASASTLGTIHIGNYHGTAIPKGWTVSDCFGFVWSAGDGVWFSSSKYGWMGVTPEGGIWCVSSNGWLAPCK